MVKRILTSSNSQPTAPDLTAAPHSERMSKVDTVWLRMDSASNLMMIVGVWIIRPGVSLAALRQRLAQRLLLYPRFTQRVRHDAMGPSWVADSEFDIKRHVVTETLSHGTASEQTALQQRVAELAVQPLDSEHPLWQFHLVPHYQGGSAIIMRIHHCIADGIALISVVMSLVDGGEPPPLRPSAPERHEDDHWLNDTLIKPLTDVSVKALHLVGAGAGKALGVSDEGIRSDGGGKGGALDMARVAYQVLGDLAALALMPDDSPTRLKGQPGAAKRVAWGQPLPLDGVKAVSRALGCSINDVLLACVAGAIGNYLRAHGEEVMGQGIRAMVPVNLRPLEEAYKLGNRFGLAPLVLPIGLSNPLERLYVVRKRMGQLKGSMQPLLTFALLAVAGLLIKPAQDVMLSLFSKKTTAVMTNVPGPKDKLKLCGATLEQSMFWVPQSGSVGLGVSILSYGGGVQFGVISDATLCPDPQAIVDGFAPEFAKLEWLSIMLPWGEA